MDDKDVTFTSTNLLVILTIDGCLNEDFLDICFLITFIFAINFND
jgi:hypothetical protein